jgi:hypothetical protein
MPQSLLTGQLKEKPTFRVWCLYSSLVHRANIHSCFMGDEASYVVGLKSAQGWGCPSSIKCLFRDKRSALIPSLRLLRTLPFPTGCFRKLADRYKCAQPIWEILIRTTCTPFPLSWGLDCIGRIQRDPMPELTNDHSLTLCPLQSQLHHIYHGKPYSRVDLNPKPESTLSPSQGLWIWPLTTELTMR